MKIETENLILTTVGDPESRSELALEDLRKIYLDRYRLTDEGLDPVEQEQLDEHELDQLILDLKRQLQSDLLFSVLRRDSQNEIGMIYLSCEDGRTIDAGWIFYDEEDRSKFARESFAAVLPSMLMGDEKVRAAESEFFH